MNIYGKVTIKIDLQYKLCSNNYCIDCTEVTKTYNNSYQKLNHSLLQNATSVFICTKVHLYLLFANHQTFYLHPKFGSTSHCCTGGDEELN